MSKITINNSFRKNKLESRRGKTRVCVVGFFASRRSADGDRKTFGGQTAKCRELRSWLRSLESVHYSEIDTYQWKRNPARLLCRMISEAHKADVILLALSENGINALLPILLALKRCCCFALGYVVIGGWIARRSADNPTLLRRLEAVDAIFAETTFMVDDLRKLGLGKVNYVPNSKFLNILDHADEIDPSVRPLPVCTFSRVCKEKGITEAVEAVAQINGQRGRQEYKLDVYGPIADDYRDEFTDLLQAHPDCVSYGGSVQAGMSTDVLRKYFLLLFPTHYYGEGFPGTVVDAFAAGLPILTSDWKNARSIIHDGMSGYIFPFNKKNEIINMLYYCLDNINSVIKMRSYCLVEAQKYKPEYANVPILDFIEANS